MTDFSTKKQIIDKLNSYKPKSIGPIGEAVVTLQFHDVFKEKIVNIDNSGKDVDLTIKFKDKENPITVEVKSSAFKSDYFIDYWIYGVPIKVKDFNYEFDLLAVVNFIPPDDNNSLGKNSRIRKDHKNVTLYFTYNELEKLHPNPFMFVPTTTLLKLRNECRDDTMNFRSFFNNYYKGIKVDPKVVFEEVGFPWDKYKLSSNWKGELGFPRWYNNSISCKYLANYATIDREFYEKEIVSKWKKRIDLMYMVENAFTNKPNKLKITEEYTINPSFCKSCTQTCKYIPTNR